MINTLMMDFPNCKVSACTVLSEDGCIAIVNSRQASDRCRSAYAHEVEHEINEDFGKEDVQAIESAAHSA